MKEEILKSKERYLPWVRPWEGRIKYTDDKIICNISHKMYKYMEDFEEIAGVKYSDIEPIIPTYIMYFIDQYLYGDLLQHKPLFKIKNREIKFGDIYALFAMLFAIYMIYVA